MTGIQVHTALAGVGIVILACVWLLVRIRTLLRDVITQFQGVQFRLIALSRLDHPSSDLEMIAGRLRTIAERLKDLRR